MNTGAAGYHRKPLSALWSWIKSKMDDEIITITKSITITTDWQDTGIKGNDIPGFGTYAVQFHGGNPTISIWGDYFSGIMTWHNSETNNNDADEISLHCAGHARNGQLFYLRTLRHGRGGDNLTLQIKGSSADIKKRAQEKGFLFLTAGPNVIRLLPPIVITREELTATVNVLKELLK